MKAKIWSPSGKSQADILRSWSHEKRSKFISSLSPEEKAELLYRWDFWARPNQLPPPRDIVDHPLGWKYWFRSCGRGEGKTRSAAEFIRDQVTNTNVKYLCLAAPIYRDVEDVMIYGESGIMSVFPEKIKPKYNSSKKIVFFHTGAIAYVLTGDQPERVRGKQIELGWLDEFAAFDYLEEFWKLLMAGNRLGDPKFIITTTPKPKPTIFELLEHPRAVFSFGSTADNKSNLAAGFVEDMQFYYGETDFAAQELGGEILGQSSGALFQRTWLNTHRVNKTDLPKLSKIVVAVDPSGSSRNTACECGIAVAALGVDGKGYFLQDASLKASAQEWAQEAFNMVKTYRATHLVYESNYGGGMVDSIFKLLRLNVPLKPLLATKDKAARAMPISGLVQKGQICLVGHHKELEMQLTTWTPDDSKSPDRLDAFVWAFTELFPSANQPARGSANLPW